MKSTASIQNPVPNKELENNAQFKAQFSEYLEKQHSTVQGLHVVLQVFSLLCIALAAYFFFAALYHTFIWATTGSLASLTAWVNYGLSMSLLVFPWGLDSILTGVFPAIIFPVSWYRSNKPIRYKTGVGAFFAGFGIMCAGAPGAVHMFNLASQAIQKLF